MMCALYLKVTKFLWILLVLQFAILKVASQLMIFMRVCSTFLQVLNSRFCANPQKYQTLVPAKNCHLKVRD